MRSLKMYFGDNQYSIYAGPEFPHKTYGFDVKRHCNAQYELHIALNGICSIDVEEKEFKLIKGDALLIAPGLYHSLKSASDDYECFVFNFFIKTAVVAKDFYENNAKPKKIHLSGFEMGLCNELLGINCSDDSFRYRCLSPMYSLLILYVFKKLDFNPDYGKNEVTDLDRRFNYIDNFFEQELAENASEEALARKLNISSRQLNRVLREYYGMSFRKKINSARMNSAGWLLRTTNMTVSEISQTVGYQSETSFFKSFRSYYNMTPLQYRKNLTID